MIEWWQAMDLAQQVFAAIGIAASVLLVIQVLLMLIGAVGGGGADAGDAAFDMDTDAGGFDADFDTPDVDVPEFDIAEASFEAPDADGYDLPDMPGDADFDLPDVGLEAEMGGGTGGYTAAHQPLNLGDLDLPEGSRTAEGGTGGLRLFTMQGLISFFAIFGWGGLLMLKGGMLRPLAVGLALVFGFIAMVIMALVMRSMLRLQQDGSLDIRNAVGKTGSVYLPIYPARQRSGKVNILVQGQYVELEAVTDDDTKLETGSQVTVIGTSGNSTLVVTASK